ncbi:MAG: hypothetical protein MJZ37_09080 [Bacilli bacterium]|nr:hypothetical protein [Bacilli bacterium]
MRKLVLSSHTFENAKYNIQRFSQSVPNSVHLPSVKTSGGLFGWGDHKVTGEELNDYTSKLSPLLVEQNNRIRDIFSEFRDVYNALEALDKDYIQAICGSINIAETAIEENKITLQQLKVTQDGLSNTQGRLSCTIEDVKQTQKDLERTQEAMKKVVEKLVSTKDELEKKVNTLNFSLEKCYSKLEDVEAIAMEIFSFDERIKGIDSKQREIDTLLSKTENIFLSAKKKNNIAIAFFIASALLFLVQVVLHYIGLL